MAIGSGLGASWGHVDESVYGTYVAPSRWLPGTRGTHTGAGGS